MGAIVFSESGMTPGVEPDPLKTQTRLDLLLSRWLDPLLLALLGFLYLANLYPLLWWGDGPELLTAAWRNGVAHPTGYPLYLLLMKGFAHLPLGSVAWRGNLFSAVAILAGAGFLFRLVPLSRPIVWGEIGWRIGIVSVVLSPIVREQGRGAEVYGLSILLFAAALFSAKHFLDKPGLRTFLLLAVACGLAAGHHRLLGLMLPGLALWVPQAFREIRRPLWLGYGLAAFLAAMLLPYGILFMRASGNPPLNWENPSTLGNLWKVFSAYQFRTDQEIMRLKEWAAYEKGYGPNPWLISFRSFLTWPRFAWDNLDLSLVAALAGAGWLVRSCPRAACAGLAAWLLPAVFIAQYHVGDQTNFQIVPFLALGLCVAQGWAVLMEVAVQRARMGGAWLVLGLATVILAFQTARCEIPPASVLELPERIARRTLDGTDPGALLMAVPASPLEPSDYTYFPLLYQKEVARRGRNVSLLSEGFFTSPWYRDCFERQGISTKLFDDLQIGTARVKFEERDLESFLKGGMNEIEERAGRGEVALRIYHVGDRYFLENRHTQAALLADALFLSSSRPFFLTARFPEIGIYLKDRLDWKEVLRIPVLTEGYSGLDGMPIPSGKLYRLDRSAS
jgi:hypothetical protein